MTLRTSAGLILLAWAGLVTAGEKPVASFAGNMSPGEKTEPTLTGNVKVDFFGDRMMAPASTVFKQDTSLGYLGESTGEKEKSPWLAGAMSLVLPGAGEVYTKNYLKGAIFFAAEAVSWFFVYTYNKKGDQQTQDYEDFANAHWSATRYTEWTLDNISVLTNGARTRTDFEGKVFTSDYDPAEANPPPFRNLDWGQLNLMEDTIGQFAPPPPAPGEPGGNGYTHHLPNYGVQQYYELIGKYPQFHRGWDDVPLYGQPGYLISGTDLPLKNISAKFTEYQLMRAESNHQYDVASTWLSVIMVNHVLSALDAYWSTTRYNKTLRAAAHIRFIPTEFGLTPYTELRLAYKF